MWLTKNLCAVDKKINEKTINNAYRFLRSKHIIDDDNKLTISKLSSELLDYLNDLLEYAIQRYEVEYGTFEGDFKKFGAYYKEQIEAILLRPNFNFMQGTQFILDEHKVILFIHLKKDENSKVSPAYKDRFLSPSLFQWESVVNTTATSGDGPKLLTYPKAYLFIRKTEKEDGLTSPFTFVGTGNLKNPRDDWSLDGKGQKSPTLLFDVELDEPISKEYWLDFDIPTPNED